MAADDIVAPDCNCRLFLDIGRAYDANETAVFLGISVYVLNERVREGKIKPMFDTGDRRYSGYMIARLLEWPLSDDPRDYLPGKSNSRRVSHRRAREEARREAADQLVPVGEEPRPDSRSDSSVGSLARPRGNSGKRGSGSRAGFVPSRHGFGCVVKRS